MKRTPIENKCPLCKINKAMCFCDQVFRIDNKVKVTIIMHHREKHLTTNTANLATRVLMNSKIVQRGLMDHVFTYEDLKIEDDETAYYLFPHEDAMTLNEEFYQKHHNQKIHLIVPDGTWRQAKKVYGREESLQKIPCVKLPEGIRSEYRLRKSPREDGVCTYEAIAYALKEIDDENIFNEMMKIFRVMVNTFINARFTPPRD